MYIYPDDHDNLTSMCPGLLTPIVTQQVIDAHFCDGLTPIVVYPETIVGNPLNAPLVVRYVLNFPGLLGGDKVYPPSEIIYAYSETLGAAAGSPQNILFIPTTDTTIFYPPDVEVRRKGSCFYAAKYKIFHKGELFDITKGSEEINREGHNIQTPKEIAALFRRSEVFYTYENTALAIEAVLCGCPAVFIPNPYLTEIIGAEELGSEGYAWGTDQSEIARARATVAKGRDNYLRLYDRFWRQLDEFVSKTYEHAEKTRYSEKIIKASQFQAGKPSPASRAFDKAWNKPWKRSVLRTTLRLVGSKVKDREHNTV